MTGIPDAEVFAALKAFQKDQSLKSTGEAKPGDETEKSLNREASKTPEGSYVVWRTVGDNRVRESHRDLEGTIRSWQDDPDPGEEINCRCWAEPVQAQNQRENLCEQLAEELRIAEIRRDGFHEDLKEAIEEYNAALREWQQAQQEYLEVAGKYAIDVGMSAERSIFGIAATVATALLEYPEFKQAKERLDKAKERFDAARAQMEYLQKEIESINAEIRRIENEMQKQACQ
ncbi:MAG: hypothetical protein IT558_03625 [Alphaproteobacteria bacterium]|nr:hypothetical protein [Alphaproteobacteria bacterium]